MSLRGVVLIDTGNGKGKTSASLGVVLRALGHGWRVLVIQLFKGDWPVVYGEVEMGKRLGPQYEVLQLGKGFVKHMGDQKPFAEHQAAGERGAAPESASRGPLTSSCWMRPSTRLTASACSSSRLKTCWGWWTPTPHAVSHPHRT